MKIESLLSFLRCEVFDEEQWSYNPVGLSMNTVLTPNFSLRTGIRALTPRVSLA